MPAVPSWFHRLDEIIATAEAYPEVWLDCRAIEFLFDVYERAGRYTMAALGGRKAGRSYTISKRELLLKLYQIQRTGRYEAEAQRRGRLVHDLARTRKLIQARKVVITTDPDLQSVDGLNPNTKLQAGRLTIEFFGTEDLLRQLMELSQAMVHDYARFQAICEAISAPVSPR